MLLYIRNETRSTRATPLAFPTPDSHPLSFGVFSFLLHIPYYLTLKTFGLRLEVGSCQVLDQLAKPETLPGMPLRSEELI